MDLFILMFCSVLYYTMVYCTYIHTQLNENIEEIYQDEIYEPIEENFIEATPLVIYQNVIVFDVESNLYFNFILTDIPLFGAQYILID